MNTAPMQLTDNEKQEIAAIKAIREMWGAETIDEMIDLFNGSIYAAKFKFHSGSPGYVGDLFILQGDVLSGDPPLVLIRGPEGRMKITEYEDQ
jgi:hypothetical protein